MTAGSQAIDVGSNDYVSTSWKSYDLAGNTRIVNGIVDLGAYEYQGTTKLATPTNVKASASGSATTVTCDSVANANQYVLYLSQDPNFEEYKAVARTSGSFSVSGLAKGTWYAKVQVRDTKGTYKNSEFSSAISFKVSSSNQLDAPTNLAASVSGTTATLTCNSVANANQYVLYYSQDPSFSSYKAVVRTSGSFSIPELNVGAWYAKAQVRNTNGTYKNSDFCPTISFKVTSKEKLATPTNLKATLSGSKVTITCSKVTNADQYVLYLDQDPSSNHTSPTLELPEVSRSPNSPMEHGMQRYRSGIQQESIKTPSSPPLFPLGSLPRMRCWHRQPSTLPSGMYWIMRPPIRHLMTT